MYLFVTILIMIVCVLLAVIVLVQNSKGGGLAANFGASNQYLGVRQTTDFLEKTTWWLAGILVFLCLAATVAIPHNQQTEKDAIESNIDINAISPVTEQQPAAAAPVAAPAPEAAPAESND